MRADPRPIVHVGNDIVNIDDLANLVSSIFNINSLEGIRTVAGIRVKDASDFITPFTSTARVIDETSGGGTSTGVVSNTTPVERHYWSFPDEPINVSPALQLDLRNLPSGQYEYEAHRGLSNALGEVFGGLNIQESQLVHINGIDSVFGHGWNIAGLQTIVENRDGSVLIIDGNGEELLFGSPNASGIYRSPEADFSTLIKREDGTFERTTEHQTVYLFNERHQLASVTDRNGNRTQYLYNAEHQISRIIDPAGLETTFSYTGNRVTKITDPAQRETLLRYDASGNLAQVTDPDGAQRTWGYDSDYHLISEIDQRGNREETYYNFAGRVVGGLRKDGSTVEIDPLQSQGLLPPDVTRDSIKAPALVEVGNTESIRADGNGNVTITQVDQYGQLAGSSDAEGPQHFVGRNSDNLISAITDPAGRVTEYTYDNQGNVTRIFETLTENNIHETQFSRPTNLIPQGSSNFRDFEITDFNGDQNIDVVLTNFDDQSISVHLGQGSGLFDEGIHLPLNRISPYSLSIADINQDGYQDIVSGNHNLPFRAPVLDPGKNLSIFYGNGDGTFLEPEYYELSYDSDYAPYSINTGDVNNDGEIDLVLKYSGIQSLTVLLGQGNNTFSEEILLDNELFFTDYVLNDVNEDGNLDIVAREIDIFNSRKHFLLTGNGDATFSAPIRDDSLSVLFQSNKSIGTSSLRYAYGDVDRDGVIDRVSQTEIFSPSNGNPDLYDELSLEQFILADVDHDLILDVVGLSSTSSFGVIFGNGDGTFNLHQENFESFIRPEIRRLDFRQTSIPALPQALAVADLNQDSYPDIVTANPDSLSEENGSILIQFGQSDGEYDLSTVIEVGIDPNFVVVEDLDGDGDYDILATNEGSQSLSVLLNDGEGTFAEIVDYQVEEGPQSLAISDLNGDQHLDVLVTHQSDDRATVLIGTGDGRLERQVPEHDVENNPIAIESGDLNGNGLDDIVTIHQASGTLAILLNQGDGSYTSALSTTVGSVLTALVLADIDNDQALDIVVTGDQDQVYVLRNQGSATWAPTLTYTVGQGVIDIELVDLNQDGWLDLLTRNADDSSLSVLLGDGEGLFGTRQDYFGYSGPLDIADLDGNGTLDIAAAVTIAGPSFENRLARLFGNGDGTFTPELPHYGIERGGLSSLGDLNGDGWLDLVTTEQRNDFDFFSAGETQVSVFLGTSGGGFSAQGTDYFIGEDATDLALRDVNNDGQLDLISLHSSSGGGIGPFFLLAAPAAPSTSVFGETEENVVSVLLGNGDGTLGPRNTYATGNTHLENPFTSNPHFASLEFADVNTDGHVDILSTDPQANATVILLGDGNGAFASRLTTSTGLTPTAIATGDFNQDGVADVVTASVNSDVLSLALGRGDGTYGSSVSLTIDTASLGGVAGLASIDLKDLNGDGTLDLLAAHQNRSAISVVFGHGDGTFAPSQTLVIDHVAETLLINDLNGDGALDLLYTDGRNLSSVLGNGDGTFATPEAVLWTSASSTNDINLADLNRDGVLDLVTTNRTNDLASVYWGIGDGTFATYALSLGTDAFRTFADLNGDGIADSVSSSGAGITVRLGTGRGDYLAPIYSPGRGTEILIEDVNGDDILDVVRIGQLHTVSVLLGQGDGSFATAVDYTASRENSDIAVAETNGDGILDLVVSSRTESAVVILRGNGDGTFIDNPLLGTASRTSNFVDLNQDGVTDFIGTAGLDVVTIVAQADGRLARSGRSETDLNIVHQVSRVGDFNLDGHFDVVTLGHDAGAVLLGQGNGTFAEPNLFELADYESRRSLDVGDFNEDGYLDLVTGSYSRDAAAVRYGLGDGTFETAQFFTVGDAPTAIATADIDQDGFLDFVTGNERGIGFTVKLNQTGDFRSHLTELEQTFTYDPVFNQQTSYVDERGQQTLTEIDPANGNALSITQVIGDVGGADDLVTRYTYTTFGLIDTVTDPLGRVTDFDYNAQGLQEQVTFAKGTEDEAVVRFEYDAAGNTTAIIDENGNRTEFDYDPLNRLEEVLEADPDGADGPLTAPLTTYDYDSAGNLTDVIDARGHHTEYVYDPLHRHLETIDARSGVSSYEYDESGNIVAETDELDRTTINEFDTRDRLVATVDPEGYRTTFEYDTRDNLTAVIDPLGNRIQYEYDGRSRLVAEIDALNGIRRYFYDAGNNLTALVDENGHATQFTYDEIERLIRTVDANLGVSTYRYDRASNIVAEIDELGRTTTYEYDERDRLIAYTDPLNGLSRYAYDDVGNLRSTTDELGRTSTYTYDALNRQETATDPLLHTTTYAYDGLDNLVSVTDALNRTTAYAYDELDRLVEITNAFGDTVTTTYDAVDNVTAITDELGRTTTYEYDRRDLRTTVTDPLGHTITTAYDGVGNVVSITDALGHQTTYGYDELYRQTRITDAIGATTTFNYDPVDNLLSITDPEQNTTLYTYDALDRRISDTNELGFTRRYRYDAVDNLTLLIDRNDRQHEYVYDDLDRLVEERWIDAQGDVIRAIVSDYDAADQLKSISDLDSSYSYDYDLAGRLEFVDNVGTAGVPNVLLEYGYDPVNNRTSVTDTIAGQQAGIEVFTYDSLNRVTRVTQSGTGVAEKRVDFGYDAASQKRSTVRYADLAGTQLVVESTYDYDLAGRLRGLTHAGVVATVAAYVWDYDAAHRITRFVSPDGESNYDYDERNQLRRADYSYQADQDYTYDDNGNRTTSGYQTGDNNRLLSDGVYTYDYDGEGNRTRRVEITTGEVTEYDWDYRNRLVGVTTTAADGIVLTTAEYTYDVYDRRIEKRVDADGDGPDEATVERFVYDNEHIALVFDGEGNQTHRYLHGAYVDQVLAEETADGQVRWALADNQGTVRDVIDSDGAVLNHISYDSFGNITGQSNPDEAFRFGYTGREFDQETGQYYYRARYFDAQVSQFISEDTIGFAGGDANLYRYVFNSPANFTDPSGNFSIGKLWNDFLTSDITYNVANGLDQFSAGFADAVTFGGTTKLREGVYGDLATRNHQGALFTAGNIGGELATLPLGGAALKGPKWIKRGVQLYDKVGDAVDLWEKGNSLNQILQGCGDLGDFLNVGLGAAQRGIKKRKGIDGQDSIGSRSDLSQTRGPEKGIVPKCFVEGTPILTRKGKKAIDELRPGDWVISWDEETGEVIEGPVTEWYQREAPAIIDIFIGVEKISCTTDHPFWVEGKGWVLAFQLKRGIALQSREGESLVIDEVRRRYEVTQVFNVEIDGFHTYFVSELEILSHNMCGEVNPKRLQSRQPPIEMRPNHVNKLRKKIRKSGFDPSKPIEVVEIDGKLIIHDGHHRAQAAVREKLRSVPIKRVEIPPEQEIDYLVQAGEAAEFRIDF